ncbi:MAG: regulatory protein RecX [Pseudohongiella sp.]|nr:regulatory protein RecX [Pseudohongiella sp.]
MSLEDEQHFRVNARRRAMDLLARREHTRQELFLKLRTRLCADGPAASAQSNNDGESLNTLTNAESLLDQVLDKLEADGLLSDARFVESFLNSRKHKGYGPLYIRHQLRIKNVDEVGLATVSEVEEAQWLDALQTLIKKRLSAGEFPKRGSKDYLKLQRFVLSRGYSVAQWGEVERRVSR